MRLLRCVRQIKKFSRTPDESEQVVLVYGITVSHGHFPCHESSGKRTTKCVNDVINIQSCVTVIT